MRSLRSALIIAAAVIPFAAQAGIRPGAELGLNLTTLVYDQTLFPNADWRTTFTGGLSAQIPLGQGELSLVPGLRYVEQGNRVGIQFTSPGGFGIEGELRTSQEYLALPMLLRFGAFPKRRWFVTLGPEVGYLLSAHLHTQVATATGVGSLKSDRDVLSQMERWNLSIGGGVGFEFPVQGHSGTLQLRYWEGLVGTAKAEDWFSDWRTRNLEFLVGGRW